MGKSLKAENAARASTRKRMVSIQHNIVRKTASVKRNISIRYQKHEINKSLEYRHKQGYWRAGPPKTEKSYRTIPLTNRAYQILKSCYEERDLRKESDTAQSVAAAVGTCQH